jgi:hypothetical protein
MNKHMFIPNAPFGKCMIGKWQGEDVTDHERVFIRRLVVERDKIRTFRGRTTTFFQKHASWDWGILNAAAMEKDMTTSVHEIGN